MSDLRNKLAQQLRDARHAAYMARRYPPKPSPQPPRCLCGLTSDQVPKMWAVPGPDRWAPTVFYCPACLPAEMMKDVMMAVENLPEP